MSLWLEGPLWLPYVEPAILSPGFDPDPSLSPSFLGEDRGENLELAALWDAKGLLCLEKAPGPVSLTLLRTLIEIAR